MAHFAGSGLEILRTSLSSLRGLDCLERVKSFRAPLRAPALSDGHINPLLVTIPRVPVSIAGNVNLKLPTPKLTDQTDVLVKSTYEFPPLWVRSEFL